MSRFTTIPKACGFEAATLRNVKKIYAPGGSLIPIVFIGMGMAFPS